jgi:hypothetical protein
MARSVHSPEAEFEDLLSLPSPVNEVPSRQMSLQRRKKGEDAVTTCQVTGEASLPDQPRGPGGWDTGIGMVLECEGSILVLRSTFETEEERLSKGGWVVGQDRTGCVGG